MNDLISKIRRAVGICDSPPSTGRKEPIKDMGEPYIFHVHTWRCGHADRISDEEYIIEALNKGAKKITFTDHAPFPGNPFGNRMDIEQLDEYLRTLSHLKSRYKGLIEVETGLEAEYLPSFKGYYDTLLANPSVDLLIMGEHFFEYEDGTYSFDRKPKDPSSVIDEAHRFAEAQIKGIESGVFSAVAHPDRCFRRLKKWDDSLNGDVSDLANAARENSVYLEVNSESVRKKNQFRPEFWRLVPEDVKRIYGCDAHSISELMTDAEVRAAAGSP